MTNNTSLNCFLSYGHAQRNDAEVLVALLQQLGVETFTAYDIGPGEVISSAIFNALRAADFVCLLLSQDQPSPNVSFEAGVAIGSGKPMLVLSTGENVPFDLGFGVQVIRLKSGDVSSAFSDLRRFVRHISAKPEPKRPETPPNLATTERAIAELRRARQLSSGADRGRALIDVVAHLFEQPGLEVMREDTGADKGIDMLLWEDSLVAELGGPLIIECKFYAGGSGSVVANAGRALRALQQYVDSSSAGLGLLVFDHDRARDLKLNYYESPKTLTFFVEDLIEVVSTGRFTYELRKRRARASRWKE